MEETKRKEKKDINHSINSRARGQKGNGNTGLGGQIIEEMHCSGETVLIPGRTSSPTIFGGGRGGVTGSVLGGTAGGAGAVALELEFADEGR